MPSRNDLVLQVTTFQLRILQSLMAIGETLSPVLDSPLDSTIAMPNDSRIVSDTVIAVFDSRSSFSRTTISQKQSTVSLKGSFAHLQTRLDVSIVYGVFQPSRSMTPIPQLRLRLGGSKAAMSPSSTHANVGNLDFQLLKNTSTEMLCATIDGLLHVFHDLQRPFSVCKKSLYTAQWRRVWGIFQVSRTAVIEDPLTQIQPSFLIQTGRPARLRDNPSWKLFMYLRHSLRLLGPSHRRTLMEMPRFDEVGLLPPVPQEIGQLLQKLLASWGYDLSVEETMALPFISYCFGPTVEPPATTTGHAGSHTAPIFINLGVIRVLIHNVHSTPPLTDENEFIIGPLMVTHRARRKAVAFHSLNKLQSVQTYTFDGDYIPVHHHAITFSLGDIRFSFHPNFVIFLQRLLPLYSAYFAPRNDPPSSLPLNSRKVLLNHNLWECFGKVSQITIQAAVEGMVAEIGLKNMDTSTSILSGLVIPHSQHRARPFNSVSCTMRLSELFTRVRQAQDKSNPFQFNEREVLASIDLTKVSLHNSFRALGDVPPNGSCLLTMRSIVISIPRSALLTYKLVEAWRIQYLP